jgi:hypothetical protein
MCLDTVDSEEKTKQYGHQGYGWKVFRVTPKGPRGVYVDNEENKPYKIGHCTRARYALTLKTNNRDALYTSGFHVFLTRKAARDYLKHISPTPEPLRVYRVRWAGPIASGAQSNNPFGFNVGPLHGGAWPVIVTKYMTILPPNGGIKCQT